MYTDIIKQISDLGIVVVIRAETKEKAIRIAEACIAGGIKVIEVTFTVPDALTVIHELNQRFTHEELLIGAGTVLDAPTAKKAIAAGVRFVVSPGFDQSTMDECLKSDVPYFPGCLTVTEMMRARSAGAQLLKLFPGSAFGPDYIKAIRGPLPDILLMPTGGVSLDNVKSWIDNGAVAVGVGGEITAPAKTGDYQAVQERSRQFVKAIQDARNTHKE